MENDSLGTVALAAYNLRQLRLVRTTRTPFSATGKRVGELDENARRVAVTPTGLMGKLTLITRRLETRKTCVRIELDPNQES